MTRSVEIPEEAVEKGAEAYWEAERYTDEFSWAELVKRDPGDADVYRKASRTILSGALPYLAPAGDGGLREALERRLATLPTMAFDNGYPVQALPKSELLSLLALYPAAPAVPQPVDREALISAIAAASNPEGSDLILGRKYVANWADVFADAVLAVSAGEQEQEQVDP